MRMRTSLTDAAGAIEWAAIKHAVFGTDYRGRGKINNMKWIFFNYREMTEQPKIEGRTKY